MMSENHQPEILHILDAGLADSRTLVVRETTFSKFIGVFAGFCFGVIASWVSYILLFKYQDFYSALFFGSLAIVCLLGTTLLLQQIINNSFYYIALTRDLLLQRRGPFNLATYKLSDIESFTVVRGCLIANRNQGKPIRLIKNTYASKNVCQLAKQLNEWNSWAEEHQESRVAIAELEHLNAQRTKANRFIIYGLRVLCCYPVMIMLAAKFQIFQANFITVAAWAVFVVAGILRLSYGIFKRVQLANTVTPDARH